MGDNNFEKRLNDFNIPLNNILAQLKYVILMLYSESWLINHNHKYSKCRMYFRIKVINYQPKKKTRERKIDSDGAMSTHTEESSHVMNIVGI